MGTACPLSIIIVERLYINSLGAPARYLLTFMDILLVLNPLGPRWGNGGRGYEIVPRWLQEIHDVIISFIRKHAAVWGSGSRHGANETPWDPLTCLFPNMFI